MFLVKGPQSAQIVFLMICVTVLVVYKERKSTQIQHLSTLFCLIKCVLTTYAYSSS